MSGTRSADRRGIPWGRLPICRDSRLANGSAIGVLILLAALTGCSTVRPTCNTDSNAEQAASQKPKQRQSEAVREFEQKRNDAEFQAALSRWQEPDAKGCREQLQRLLARDPNHRDARLLMAEVFLSANRYEEALKEVQQVLQAHPDDPAVQFTMGMILDAMGQHAASLAYYQRAAKAEPNNEVYAVGYQMAAEAQQDKTTAIPDTLPQAPMPGPLPARSVVAASAAVADPVDRSGADPATDLVQKANAALDKGSVEEALVLYREAASLKPDNRQKVLISAATSALRRNQPELAIELLTPEGKPIAHSAAVYRILGTARYRQGDYQGAQVALRQALSLDKSSALAYFLMGCTLVKLGQAESAESHFRQASALDARYTIQR